MALRDWISYSGQVATATVATPATLDLEYQLTVATVATVSVARKGKNEELALSVLAGKAAGAPAGTVNLPNWCRIGCQELAAVTLPVEGPRWGCVQQRNDCEQWTRLDWLNRCPNRSRVVH